MQRNQEAKQHLLLTKKDVINAAGPIVSHEHFGKEISEEILLLMQKLDKSEQELTPEERTQVILCFLLSRRIQTNNNDLFKIVHNALNQIFQSSHAFSSMFYILVHLNEKNILTTLQWEIVDGLHSLHHAKVLNEHSLQATINILNFIAEKLDAKVFGQLFKFIEGLKNILVFFGADHAAWICKQSPQWTFRPDFLRYLESELNENNKTIELYCFALEICFNQEAALAVNTKEHYLELSKLICLLDSKQLLSVPYLRKFLLEHSKRRNFAEFVRWVLNLNDRKTLNEDTISDLHQNIEHADDLIFFLEVIKNHSLTSQYVLIIAIVKNNHHIDKEKISSLKKIINHLIDAKLCNSESLTQLHEHRYILKEIVSELKLPLTRDNFHAILKKNQQQNYIQKIYEGLNEKSTNPEEKEEDLLSFLQKELPEKTHANYKAIVNELLKRLIEFKNVKLIAWLIQNGAVVDKQVINQTAIHGTFEIAAITMGHEAKFEAKKADGFVQLAFKARNADMVSYSLQQHKLPLDTIPLELLIPQENPTNSQENNKIIAVINIILKQFPDAVNKLIGIAHKHPAFALCLYQAPLDRVNYSFLCNTTFDGLTADSNHHLLKLLSLDNCFKLLDTIDNELKNPNKVTKIEIWKKMRLNLQKRVCELVKDVHALSVENLLKSIQAAIELRHVFILKFLCNETFCSWRNPHDYLKYLQCLKQLVEDYSSIANPKKELHEKPIKEAVVHLVTQGATVTESALENYPNLKYQLPSLEIDEKKIVTEARKTLKEWNTNASLLRCKEFSEVKQCSESSHLVQLWISINKLPKSNHKKQLLLLFVGFIRIANARKIPQIFSHGLAILSPTFLKNPEETQHFKNKFAEIFLLPQNKSCSVPELIAHLKRHQAETLTVISIESELFNAFLNANPLHNLFYQQVLYEMKPAAPKFLYSSRMSSVVRAQEPVDTIKFNRGVS